MKFISFLSAFILLQVLPGCSNKFTGKQTPAGPDWFMTIHEHNKLVKKYSKCEKHPEKCTDTLEHYQINQDQLNYIMNNPAFNHPHIDTITVRYRHADQKKYKQLWGIEGSSKKGKVRRYTTKIWKVTFTRNDKTLPGFDSSYYIIEGDPALTMYSFGYRICPPPKPCN